MKISKKLFLSFKIILTGTLIIFLLKRLNLGNVFSIIIQVNWHYLVLAAILFFLILLIQSYRWQCLLGVHGIKIGLVRLIRLTFIGFFFNNFLPSTVGGDVVKGYLVSKATKKTAESYVSVLMDRIIGIVGLFFLGFMVLFFIPELKSNQTLMYLLWGGFTVSFLLIAFFVLGRKFWMKRLGFLKRILKKLKIEGLIEKIAGAFSTYRRHRGVLIKTVLMSTLVHLFFIAVNFTIVKGFSLPQKIPFIDFFIYTPTIALISCVPISVNGLGLRENLYVEFFSRSLGKNFAGSLSIIFLIFLWAAGFIGGIFYLFSHLKSNVIGTIKEKGKVSL